MHFPLSFCKNASPYFFHGAFAPSFIWSRRPWTSVTDLKRHVCEQRRKTTKQNRNCHPNWNWNPKLPDHPVSFISTTGQLRRDDVTYGDHGQSGQAIKLFSVTLYVNYFKIFNNLGSRQPLGSSKNQFHLTFLTQVFHRWWCETCRVLLSNDSFKWKKVTF